MKTLKTQIEVINPEQQRQTQLIAEECPILDELDEEIVRTMQKKQAKEIVNSVQNMACPTIDITEATIDPMYHELGNDDYQRVFKLFHNIILKHGQQATDDIQEVFEFVVQLDNKKKLSINREVDIVNKDYLDFTIDLKNDRGKIFVGSCEDAKKRADQWIDPEHFSSLKPSLVFMMRDQDFQDLLDGKLGIIRALTGNKIKMNGNPTTMQKFHKNFLQKYYTGDKKLQYMP